MAKQVIWSIRAQQDRKQILFYWNNHNKSTAYSIKLNEKFKEALKLVSKFPQIGKRTDDAKARIKIVRDYFLIYEGDRDQNYFTYYLGQPSRSKKLRKNFKSTYNLGANHKNPIAKTNSTKNKIGETVL